MHRPLLDRARDRIWREVSQRLSINEVPALKRGESTCHAGISISCNMPWVDICAAYADGTLESRQFRRLKAVRNVVETVGITEARFYVGRIKQWGSEWLGDQQVQQLDSWGDPLRCPGMLLGTSTAYSPTTLRYLATALWLRRSGKLATGARILEIGVGFGGLAAMNALVSSAHTLLADLPQVEQAALRMLTETGFEGHAKPASSGGGHETSLVISNYAFSELSSATQDDYLDRYLRHARHGVIVSNAAVFAHRIGGRSDSELVQWLRDSGVPASIEDEQTCDLLTPIDALCGVRLIHW